MIVEPTERRLNDVMQLGQVQGRRQEQLAPDRGCDVLEGDFGLDDGRTGIEHGAIMAVIRVSDNERRQDKRQAGARSAWSRAAATAVRRR
jgi:hypothetical protein